MKNKSVYKQKAHKIRPKEEEKKIMADATNIW